MGEQLDMTIFVLVSIIVMFSSYFSRRYSKTNIELHYNLEVKHFLLAHNQSFADHSQFLDKSDQRQL